MISKSQSKFIKSLQLKKYRKQEQCFVVDGKKGVGEVMDSDYEIVQLVLTPAYLESHREKMEGSKADIIVVTEGQLAQLGSFQTNESVIAIVRQKPNRIPTLESNEYMLVLDDIRDPGNLGSIIRTADWFGVRKIVASSQTADFYNPKVINATMGSFTRVQFAYGDLKEELSKIEATVYGTFMAGESIHDTLFASHGVIVIGNEAQGISEAVQNRITHRITIPGVKGAESLNAAVATGILLDNWSRLKK